MKRWCGPLLPIVLSAMSSAYGQLTITTSVLPTGTAASAYSAALGASGGTVPYSWNVGESFVETIESNVLEVATNAMGWHSSLDGWWLALPFEFPFYGVVYTQCFVATEGYVHFKSGYLNESGNTNVLGTNCMIAANWKNISTAEGWPNADIYVSTNSSTCVIRWVGRTPMMGSVAATLELNAGGRIRINRIGDGDMMLPRTVGVSAGNGLHVTASTNNTAILFDQMLQFTPTNGLPAALHLYATGSVYGIPSATGTTTVNLAVLDSVGAATSRTYSLVVQDNVNQQPVILSNSPPTSAFDVAESTSRVFAVYASDPESQPLHYVWTWNGAPVGSDSNVYTLSTDWGQAGVYTARAYVADAVWTNHEVFSTWTVTVLADNDGDGLPNAWERQYPGTMDPWTADAGGDTDHDGVTNAAEYAHGCSPSLADTDGDSLRDGWEIERGFNPTNVMDAAPGITNFVARDGLYLTEHARDVEVVSNRAYVACGYGGLKIYSVTNPASPTVLGILDVGRGQHADSLRVEGSRVYLPVNERGLMILDAGNPAAITVLGEYTNGTPSFGPVCVDSNRAYLAMNTDLAILDVSDPASPALFRQLRISSTNTATHIHDVAVRSGYVYCANYSEGLKTVDATSPASAHIVATNEFVRVGVCDYAARGLALRGETLFMAQDGYGLMSFSLANPAAPVLINHFIPSVVPFPYDALSSVWVNGSNAAVIGGTNLWMLNVSDPSNLVELSRWTTGGPELDGVHLATGRVAMASGWGIVPGVGLDRGGLRLLDVSNPAAPTNLGRAITSGQPWNFVVRGNLAYVANYDGGLHIVDVSNPTNLHRLGRYDTPGQALGVALSADGHYAAVADGSCGLTVLDVSVPTSIQFQAALALTGTAQDVVVLDGRIYVAARTNGLLVVTNFTSPGVWTNFSDGASIQGLAAYASNVFAAAGAAGLYAFHYENRGGTDIWTRSKCDYGATLGGIDAERLAVDQQRAWVADPLWGVMAVDVASIGSMNYLGRYAIPLAQDTWVENTYVWLAVPTNVTAFHAADPVDSRGILRYDVAAAYNPEIKSVWASRSNGLCARNVGPGRYDYGLMSFTQSRVDEDEDGLPDAREMGWFGSLAQGRTNDFDGDGLNNWGEWLTGTDPTIADSDGDGMSDFSEYVAGTDPRLAESLFQMEMPMEQADMLNRHVISWHSVSNRFYDVWRSTNLLDAAGFTTIATDIPATPPVNVHTDTVFGGQANFYRVETSGP